MTEKLYNTDTMFCLVSQQTIPNIIPCLQENIKPKTVVLIYTKKMKEYAEYIKSTLKNYNNTLAVEFREISDSCADYYDDAWEETTKILGEYKNNRCSLNMTGGTKVLSTATSDVFKDIHKDNKDSIVFYMGLQTSKIHIMTKSVDPIDITKEITVKQYFQSYGYEIKKFNNSVNNDLKQQRLDWIKNSKIHALLSTINFIASNPNKIDSNNKTHNKVITELENCNIMKNKKFISEEIRKYANGEWLEQYIFETLNKNRNILGINDILWGVEIKRDTRNNELDIVFTRNTTLYIVECKTKHYEGTETENRNKELYKIFAIKQNLGAIASKSAIVSLLPLENESKNRIKDRAKDLKIKTFIGNDLCEKQFIEKIKKWIK